ncbi:MAG TPA: hypothetical protein VFT50_03295 [Baekduia sp.]|nr:hypothetical protein [Baekduia sp.]
MSTFPGGEGPLMGEGPKAEHPDLQLYGHVEELCREEVELLEIEEHERTAHHHARLRAIEAELDRAWERLHHRHQHLKRPAE